MKELSVAQHQLLDALLTLEQRQPGVDPRNHRFSGKEVARELSWSTQRAGAILGTTRKLGLTAKTPYKFPTFYLTSEGRESALAWRAVTLEPATDGEGNLNPNLLAALGGEVPADLGSGPPDPVKDADEAFAKLEVMQEAYRRAFPGGRLGPPRDGAQ